MSLENTILEKIQETKTLSEQRNDAISEGRTSLAKTRKIISDCIGSANSTASIDEKIDILVEGYKSILDLQESSLVTLIEDVSRYKTKIETLEEVMSQSSSQEESKKKDSEPAAPEQE